MEIRVRVGRVAVGALVAVAALGGWTAAGAVGGGGANPEAGGSGNHAVPPAGVRAALAGSSKTEQYTGITPCRILDTRKTAAMNSATRSFDVSGNLTSQGGASACGIPSHATSIAVNLTGLSQGGSTGYVRGWAAGGSAPTATLLNFAPGLNASNQVNVPLCRAGACPDAFTLRTVGNAHLVGDVVGYYSAPLYVAVSPSGTVYQNIRSGVVSVTRTGPGKYDVIFDRNVLGCSFTASSITWSSNLDASPDGSQPGTPTRVTVGIANSSSALVDDFFYLQGTC